jgi:hypothetical protein
VIFGRTSALLLAMVTPYFFTYYLVTEQGRENTQPAEMWQKGGFLPHKRTKRKTPARYLLLQVRPGH